MQSTDGAVALGAQRRAAGRRDRPGRHAVLRTMADVLVVGAGTVRAEGYRRFALAGALTDDEGFVPARYAR
ncbi:hypothetical protein [Microbacterium sp. BWT-B31]|uniref:hypothetical protein n=1 Tax=Microbacterium sp. BWT-B31 TaxID=3232072 RepID=UPI0035271487